jgi:hypothetical protein
MCPCNYPFIKEIKDKNLLLKDLCARLTYGVKCTTKSLWNGIYTIVGYKDNRVFLDCPIYEEGDDEWMIESIVPYLRPMSSISSLISAKEWSSLGGIALIDWYNANHIDYRDLIEKGLALEAPKGMYNLEKK